MNKTKDQKKSNQKRQSKGGDTKSDSDKRESAARQDPSENKAASLAGKTMEQVEVVREKAGEAVSEVLETASESVAKAQEQVTDIGEKVTEAIHEKFETTHEAVTEAQEKFSEVAHKQKEHTEKSLEDVTKRSLETVEKAAKTAISAAKEATAAMEETAEDFAETLKDFTGRYESETVSGKLAEERQMRVGHVAYLLHALWPVTLVSGVFGLFLCYLRQGDSAVNDTVLRSHFRWLVRTFWLGAGGLVIAAILGWAVGDLPAGLMVLVTLVWFAYRIVKGWLALYDGKEIAKPAALL